MGVSRKIEQEKLLLLNGSQKAVVSRIKISGLTSFAVI